MILETGRRISLDFTIKSINDSAAQLDIMLEVPTDLPNQDNSFYFSKKDGKITYRGISQVPKLSVCAEIKCRCSGRLVEDWEKEGNELLLGENKRISFDYPIRAILNSFGVFVILLEIPTKQSMTENVFGVSQEGEILWQIEKIPETATDPVNRYTGIGDSNIAGIVVAFNWNCTNVFVDINTGKVIDTEFTK